MESRIRSIRSLTCSFTVILCLLAACAPQATETAPPESADTARPAPTDTALPMPTEESEDKELKVTADRDSVFC